MKACRNLICILAAGMLAGPGALAETAGHVQVVVGTAQVVDAKGQPRPVERGMEIQQGDRIVTGDGALVQLKLTDGSYLSVRTNTDLTVEKYKFDEKTPQGSSLFLKLAQGALRSITGLIGSRNPGGYQVATPTATIGIRGTDHEPVFIPEPRPGEVAVAPPGTYDKVNSGNTFIQTTAGVVDIRPGQVGFVPTAQNAVPKVLPAIPEFFKKLDVRGEGALSKQLRSPLIEGRNLRLVQPVAGGTISKSATDTSTTLSTRTLSPSTAYPTLSPDTSTNLSTTRTISTTDTTTASPTTSTISPTTTTTTSYPTLSTDSSLITTKTISSDTTTLSPTTSSTLSTTTISPTTTTTTTYPTLSTDTSLITTKTISSDTTTLSPTTSSTLSTTTISPTTSTLSTTTISPTTSTLSTTTISPTTSTLSTTTISPTTSTLSTTTISPTRTLSPTTTTISPTSTTTIK